MAAITKNRNFFKWPKLLYFKPESAKIEQFWPFEEISIFSNGGHIGYRTALTNTILKGDHLRIIQMATVTKNRNFFKWPKLLYFKPESAHI
jgi:hypothetical protein